MEEAKQPTLEAVEAALSQRTNEQKRENIWTFTKLMKDSPALRDALKQLRDNPVDDVDMASILLGTATEFFFLGWHARGAVEDAGQLKKLME